MINDSIVNGVRRSRTQNNFDERLFTEATYDGQSVSLIRVEAPQRTPQKCERYSVGELRAVHLDEADSTQEIISETSSISDVRSRVRTLRQKIRDLHFAYSLDLRQKWTELLTKRKTVTYYEKTSTMAFRKAKWKKVPTGKSKLIVRYVYLKPRPQHVVRKSGGKTVDFGIMWVRPRVRRELIVPIYTKILLRPAGLRRVTVRKKVQKQVIDWDQIRPIYTVYKVERRARLDADLAPLQSALADCIRIAAARMQQPHRLVSCTNTGWIPPSWEEYYYQYFRGSGTYEDVYAHYRKLDFGSRPGWGVTASGPMTAAVVPYSAISVCVPVFEGRTTLIGYNASSIQAAMRALEIGYKIQSPGSFKALDMLIPRTVVDRMVLLKSAYNAEALDDQSEALAASTTRSLRNKGDYVFNLPRSIGELKDSKDTYREAASFLRWFARGTRTRNALPEMARVAGGEILRRTGKASLAIIGAYLAWKFAIQPTIQDIETLRSHTAEWLLATRRALMESIRDLRNTSSNILHIRTKFFGDSAVRSKSLKNIVMDVDAREEYVELSSWTNIATPTLGVFKGADNVVSSSSSIENIRWGGCDGAVNISNTGVMELYGSVADRRWKYDGLLPGVALSVGTVGSKEPTVIDIAGQPFTYDVGVRESLPLIPLDSSASNVALAEMLGKQRWPRVNCNGYLFNQVSGVLFARYQLGSLLEFLDLDHQNSDLAALLRLVQASESWADLLDRLWREGKFKLGNVRKDFTSETAAMLAAWDTIYVTWQLTPLSFMYDWLTTSDSVVTVLNNFLTEYSVPAPPAMEGVWETKRLELLAGRPALEVDRVEAESYVSDWYGGNIRVDAECTYTGTAGRPMHVASSNSFYWAYPKRLSTTHRIWYKSSRKVALSRSGLYAAKRGEFIDGGWETFLPQVQIRLNASKVGTMLGILAGLIAPRRQA